MIPQVFIIYSKEKGSDVVHEIGQAYVVRSEMEAALAQWKETSPELDFDFKALALKGVVHSSCEDNTFCFNAEDNK